MAEPIHFGQEQSTSGMILPNIVDARLGNLGDAERLYHSLGEFTFRKAIYGYPHLFLEPTDNSPYKMEEATDWAIKNANFLKAKNVAELGCSGGVDLIGLADKGIKANLLGIDTKEEIVWAGQEKALLTGHKNIDFMVGKAEDLSFIEDESLDAILGWYMMYEPDPVVALANIWTKLKPGGLLLVTTHNDFNIPIHRLLERLVGMFTGGELTEPKIKAKRFWVASAKQMLADQGYEKLWEKRGLGPLKIPPEARGEYWMSLYTRWQEFQPQPSERNWKKVMNEVFDPYIGSEVEKRGYILDFFDRWGAVYRKPIERGRVPRILGGHLLGKPTSPNQLVVVRHLPEEYSTAELKTDEAKLSEIEEVAV